MSANTIMTTTQCSGGCTHCPFSNPLLDKLFLPTESIVSLVNQSEKLAILSGGEPFEHPEILKILIELSTTIIPFRIATGGFIELDKWIDKLKELSQSNIAFKGISMGTDVLSNRVLHSNWVPVWQHNINSLIDAKIPFSLTLTIDSEFELNRFNLFSWTEIFKDMPEFIYLRYRGDEDIWIKRIKDGFENAPILLDKI